MQDVTLDTSLFGQTLELSSRREATKRTERLLKGINPLAVVADRAVPRLSVESAPICWRRWQCRCRLDSMTFGSIELALAAAANKADKAER